MAWGGHTTDIRVPLTGQCEMVSAKRNYLKITTANTPIPTTIHSTGGPEGIGSIIERPRATPLRRPWAEPR